VWFTMKLAWRNIFRNKRRAIIAGIAIGVGLASLIFTDAVILSMKKSMIRSATDTYMGEGQIHRDGFRLTQDVELTINDPDRVLAALAKDGRVAAFTPRAESFGMATSPANVSSVMVVGVDPVTEKAISKVDDTISQGAFFAGADPHDVVIGSKLAETLDVGLGDRLVLTVSQARTGDLAQDLFRVSGIYHFGIREMDAGFAFIRLARAQEMLAIGDGIHEIALVFGSFDFAMRKDNPFWAEYTKDGNEAVSWAVLFPQLEGVMGLVWVSLLFMAVILFGIVAFGIINTLFMSLYERMFEFGVLRAVGTRASGVRRLIVFEAGALAVISNVLGMVLGLTFAVSKIGIDYRGIEFAGTTFDNFLYPILTIRQFIIYPLAVFLFTLFVGLYPARVAGKMRIAEALRKSL
jgi:ABC-type lipoprotein release transport system permease subunit